MFERVRDAGIPLDPNIYSAVAGLIVIALALCIAFRAPLPVGTPGAMEKMLIGCGIYSGSFILPSNSNYRLIFLLLAVPQLLARRATGGRARRLATAALLTIAVALCLSGQLRSWLFLLKQGANWLIFTGASCVLFQAAADWLRGPANVQPASNSASVVGSFTGA